MTKEIDHMHQCRGAKETTAIMKPYGQRKFLQEPLQLRGLHRDY